MLGKILKMLGEERNFSLLEMADAMNISSDMMHSILEDLVRMGYLRKVRPEHISSGSCASCSCNSSCPGSCDTAVENTIWELTGKSRNRMQRSIEKGC